MALNKHGRHIAELPISTESLTWLLVSLVMVIAPHAGRMPLWITGTFILCGAWRYMAQLRGWHLPGKWMLLFLAASAAAGIVSVYHTLFGRDAGVAMLIVMLSLKLLEMRSSRDSMLAAFLGFFLVVTNFLYTQTILTGLYMMLVLIVLIATLIAIQYSGERLLPRAKMKMAAILLMQALPLALVLFVLFPRVNGPLWGLPKDAFGGITGLSDSMSPGSISRLIQSGDVAFRVVFDGPLPKEDQRYWRGPIFWDYDGRTWRNSRNAIANIEDITSTGSSVSYTVTLEPQDQRWLFALDMPTSIPANTVLTKDFQLLAPEKITQRKQYHLTSSLEYRAGLSEDAFGLKRGLRLPANGDPRSRELASRWRRESVSNWDIVLKALTMFRNEPFVYTMRPPLLGGDPIDGFLFDTRRGFCEHYAGSFVFLMRAAGVPARVVTGYQGGEYNALGNYLVVRQSDAHAWAEVWLKDRGWVRVDPTAAVSPLRIEQGITAALPEAAVDIPFMLRHDTAWLRRLRLSLDTINNQWNQWVLSYTPERQVSLWSRLGLGIPSWRELAEALVASVVAIMLVMALLLLRGRSKRQLDEIQRLYFKFCSKLARAGFVRGESEGPLDFSARVISMRPDLKQSVMAITNIYTGLRYGRAQAETLRQLREAIRQFRVQRT